MVWRGRRPPSPENLPFGGLDADAGQECGVQSESRLKIGPELSRQSGVRHIGADRAAAAVVGLRSYGGGDDLVVEIELIVIAVLPNRLNGR